MLLKLPEFIELGMLNTLILISFDQALWTAQEQGTCSLASGFFLFTLDFYEGIVKYILLVVLYET